MEAPLYAHLYALEDHHWWFRGRRAVIWALLRRAGVDRAHALLDAGCGTGRNLVEFGRLADGEAAGIDPSPDAVEFCHQRGLEGVREAGLEELPFPDGHFDLALATDVVEHVDDDLGALRELRRVSASGGRLLLTVPAYGWLWSEHDDFHHHKRRYTLPRLRERAIAAGWRVDLETYFNSVLLAPIAAVRTAQRLAGSGGANGDGKTNYDLTPGRLNEALTLPMRGEARLIERGGTLPAGVSVGMVCTRA